MTTSIQSALQPDGFPGLPAGWETRTGTFASADGTLQLFSAVHFKPGFAPEAGRGRALMIVHGMGEHGGRYLHFPHYLQEQVDAVYVHDHRGHGRSEGIRGHAGSIDELVDDAIVAFKRIKSPEVHLFGHSMGGLVALRMLLLHPDLALRSASISAPFLGIRKEEAPLAKRVGALALSKVWSNLQLSTGLDAAVVSRNPSVVEKYKSDRLVHDKMTPGFFAALGRAFKDTFARAAAGIHQPIQFYIPLADRAVDTAKALAFYDKLTAREKSLKQYEGYFHESFNDLGKERFFTDLAEWVGRH